MILAVFVIVGITGLNGGLEALSLQGYTAGNACNFGPNAGPGAITISVPAGASKKTIQAAAQTAIAGYPCYQTFGSGDSAELVP